MTRYFGGTCCSANGRFRTGGFTTAVTAFRRGCGWTRCRHSFTATSFFGYGGSHKARGNRRQTSACYGHCYTSHSGAFRCFPKESRVRYATSRNWATGYCTSWTGRTSCGKCRNSYLSYKAGSRRTTACSGGSNFAKQRRAVRLTKRSRKRRRSSRIFSSHSSTVTSCFAPVTPASSWRSGPF